MHQLTKPDSRNLLEGIVIVAGAFPIIPAFYHSLPLHWYHNIEPVWDVNVWSKFYCHHLYTTYFCISVIL